MMPTLIETSERGYQPHCTRKQARELLEALRAAYQSLSLPGRTLFKGAISRLAREQFIQELDQENHASN
jgi:hypothetical protein